jgi:phosphatidylglycerophosphate synthase
MDNKTKEANARVRYSRERTNLLRAPEFKTLEFLCSIMPSWATPNMMTVIGVIGSGVIAYGLYLARAHENSLFLLVSIGGFIVQWFGDSMDGRLAYYRNIPRKWYGWSLDIFADWCSIMLTTVGIYFYFPDVPYLALLFLFAYGGTLILTISKFTITTKYTIDSGLVGPTELRVITCLMFLIELGVPGFLYYFGFAAPGIIFVVNILELRKILKLGDARDRKEKSAKKKQPVLQENEVQEPV